MKPENASRSRSVEHSCAACWTETGLAVSGPNCLGNLNASARLMTMPDDRPQRLAAGPVAIIGQSGGIAMAIKRTLEERGVDCGSVITSGNESGLTTADYIDYFADAPGVKAIVSYLESVHDRDAFLGACRARESGRQAGRAGEAWRVGRTAARRRSRIPAGLRARWRRSMRWRAPQA